MSLEPGVAAPDFSLPDQHGTTVTLSSFRGERDVLLVFFPFAFTGVCTGELRDLRDRRDELEAAGAVVLALSCDSMFSLRVFADRDRLELPLLSDFWPHGAVAAAYGVLDERRGCPTRSTFLVDRAGTVRWTVHSDPGAARSVEEYLRELGRIRSAPTGR